ncbi:MAG TPA: 50S ribosomal protein L25 [Pseudobdellovibrionaceae bacterium]|nr:50S ribosomal protein L25 [Pseudobdellovibrionaceae bacterium]
MKQRIELNVEPRQPGKGTSRTLRSERKVPAVVYGAGENASIWINEGDVVRYNVRTYENALFNLKSSEAKANGKVVLIKQVTVHPVNRRPQHVDFFALDLNKTVRVNVEIRLEGKPAGLADGGFLNVDARQVEGECLPTNIPEFIVADVSGLGVGDTLHVSDLQVAEGVRIVTGAEQTLATVSILEEEAAAAPAADAAAAPAAAAATPAAAAPAKDAAKK